MITPVGMTVAASTLMSANPTWQIWVGDDDGCSPSGNNCTADVACTIRQQISESTLRSGELVVTNRQSCAQVTLDFICQPTTTAHALRRRRAAPASRAACSVVAARTSD